MCIAIYCSLQQKCQFAASISAKIVLQKTAKTVAANDIVRYRDFAAQLPPRCRSIWAIQLQMYVSGWNHWGSEPGDRQFVERLDL
jgi:hypothetical protein